MSEGYFLSAQSIKTLCLLFLRWDILEPCWLSFFDIHSVTFQTVFRSLRAQQTHLPNVYLKSFITTTYLVVRVESIHVHCQVQSVSLVYLFNLTHLCCFYGHCIFLTQHLTTLYICAKVCEYWVPINVFLVPMRYHELIDLIDPITMEHTPSRSWTSHY